MRAFLDISLQPVPTQKFSCLCVITKFMVRTMFLNRAKQRYSIQKGSVQCTVGASNIGYLLSSVRYSRSFNNSKGNVFIYLPCIAIYSCFSVFKLVVKSVAVLLEDHRSETSCKRNITTITLLYQLRLRLRHMALRLSVVNRRPESVVLAC